MLHLVRNAAKLSNKINLCALGNSSRNVHHRATNILRGSSNNVCNNIRRNIHPGRPKLPTIVFLPQIFSFYSSKMKFKWLQKKWDPEFTEGAFIYGSSKAICTITKIIHDDQPERLFGLMTESARQQLTYDMKVNLRPDQKRIIAVQPDDIKLLVPQNVQLLVNDWKDVEREGKAVVLLKSVALKWHEEQGRPKVAFIVIVAELSRVYEPGVKEGWSVSYFKVKNCELMKSRWKF